MYLEVNLVVFDEIGILDLPLNTYSVDGLGKSVWEVRILILSGEIAGSCLAQESCTETFCAQ